jgi:putative oxidoreductase
MDFSSPGGVWPGRALMVLRIVTALLFLEHGTQKLLGFPVFPSGNGPAALSLPWFAGVIELVGGVMVLVGFLVRPAAFIMSGTMAIAYFWAHAPRSFFPVNNGGDAAILFCFVFLYLAVVGGGAWNARHGSATR